jgi:hypothetical protein
MITNPHAGTFTESGWALGFAFGFMGPRFSNAPPALIAPELIDAFNEGRLVGQQTAIDGLSLTPECMDASQEASNAAEGLVTSIHILEGLGTAVDFLASQLPPHPPLRGMVAPAKTGDWSKLLSRRAALQTVAPPGGSVFRRADRARPSAAGPWGTRHARVNCCSPCWPGDVKSRSARKRGHGVAYYSGN